MESDPEDPQRTPASWGQRHGLTIMLIVMAVLMGVVIVVQMKT